MQVITELIALFCYVGELAFAVTAGLGHFALEVVALVLPLRNRIERICIVFFAIAVFVRYHLAILPHKLRILVFFTIVDFSVPVVAGKSIHLRASICVSLGADLVIARNIDFEAARAIINIQCRLSPTVRYFAILKMDFDKRVAFVMNIDCLTLAFKLAVVKDCVF